MRFLNTLIIALMLTVGAYAQFSQGEDLAPTNVALTLGRMATTTDSTLVPTGMAPIAIFMDTVNYHTTGYFEVSFGTSATRRWYKVTAIGDSAIAYLPIVDSSLVPVSMGVTSALIGTQAGIVGTYTTTSPVWIRLVITTAQTYAKYIYVRMRYF